MQHVQRISAVLVMLLGLLCGGMQAEPVTQQLVQLKVNLGVVLDKIHNLKTSLNALDYKEVSIASPKVTAVVGRMPVVSSTFQKQSVKFYDQKIYSMLTPTKLVYHYYGMSLNLVPSLGVYGHGYPMRPVLLLLEFDTKKLNGFLPKNIQEALRPYPSAQQSFCVVIQGSLGDLASNLRNNVVFHGLLVDTAIKGKQPPKFDCQKNIEMGVFDEAGATSTKSDIARNTLEARSVYCHDGRVSPDNAHVVFEASKFILPFWSVGVSYDHARVAITYHLVINNQDLSERINQLANSYGSDVSLAEILSGLIKIDPALSLSRFVVP